MKERSQVLNSSPFPFTAGAIDIGSNALRFLAVDVDGPKSWRQLDSARLPLRLGHDVFFTGRMEAATMRGAPSTDWQSSGKE